VGDYLDPFTFLDLFSTPTGNNGSGWFDPNYARALRDANRHPDPVARNAALAAAERMLLDAQPIIPLQTSATNYVRKPYVKGLHPNPLTIHPWKFVYIEHDPSKWNDPSPAEAGPHVR
jgi:oligopeptide transport system substrate-binding protein